MSRQVVITCMYRPHVMIPECWCKPDQPYVGVYVHKVLTCYEPVEPKMAVFSDQYQRMMAPGE